MRKRMTATIAVLFSVMLLAPIALADVYVPPGPWPSMDAWISPTLMVIDTQDVVPKPIGWAYSDGPLYDNVAQNMIDKVEKEFPRVIGKLEVQFSTYVVIFGWIPKVYVSPDQVPPPVEIVITWNGMPYLVTLTRTDPVGMQYPAALPKEKTKPYEFTYPYDPTAPWKDAFYNIYVGDIDDVRGDPNMPFKLPDIDFPSGYFFWYRFHPNAGDYISFDCQPGETKHPPTYDVTALFEFSTSQIWFNHVCFDVRFLEVHKTIKPNPILNLGPITGTLTVIDEITVENVGKVAATQLDVVQSFPSSHLVAVLPLYGDAVARIEDAATGATIVPTQSLPSFTMPYVFKPPFDKLKPGEKLVVNMPILVTPTPGWGGTIVFDVMVSAWEIPPWKYPRSMDGLIFIGSAPPGPLAPLFTGWKLEYTGNPPTGWWFHEVDEWFVPTPIIRDPDLPTQPKPKMKLDPVPVDLNGDGKINALDVALVRQAIVGLIEGFDLRMDINVNGRIDTQDLTAYKLAAH